jgi:hypothetical protein
MSSYTRLLRKISKYIYRSVHNKDLRKEKSYVKEDYDNISEFVVDMAPIKCPVYQCGGIMKVKIRRPPKD